MSLRVKAGVALVLGVIAAVVYILVSGLSLDERSDIGAKPDAHYDGRTMREVLRDASGALRRHSPPLANRLLWEADRGLGPVDVGTP